MNILLISQCSKNALTETRRIIDQFAERRGDRCWQTAITQQGLDTLYRLLRRTARKNTAVACHWIRSKDHSEMLWIVGDARQFNGRGVTPTGTTRRDVLRTGDENDWHVGEDIRLLARLAALFHDIGKANDAFQKKLSSHQPIADPYRHEWVSLRLFEAFVGDQCKSDRDWLERLEKLDGSEGTMVIEKLFKDGQGKTLFSPFRTLQLPLASVIGWLIVSHHRLPTPGREWALSADNLARLPRAIAHDWCGSRTESPESSAACWAFSRGLSFESRHWRQHVAEAAKAILKRANLTSDAAPALLVSPYVLHLSRLALMLADHYYSGQPSHGRYGDKQTRPGKGLYANSLRDGEDKRVLNQRLDEHLIGVEVNAGRLIRTLPRLALSLPRIARHKGFRARSGGVYRWQNTASDLAESLRERSVENGFFGVNLASTGCGKTLANGRILYGLSDPQLGARFTIALGLRVLTLQTGDAYRQRLNLGPGDLAVLVGGTASSVLHEHFQQQRDPYSTSGSESAADLLPFHSHVRYEGSLEDGPLKHWLYPAHKEGEVDGRRPRGRSRDASAMLDAPVLVCTVDHLTPATEATRGGHQILPMLRLMTSDLVLDEPDDFDMADLPAITRLVHWGGMLGSRVLLSSATLPAALVQGLFLAYCAGRREFQRYRGHQGERLSICCSWFDEFGVDHSEHGGDSGGATFLAAHNVFVGRRIAQLAKEESPRRRATIVPVSISKPVHGDKARRQEETRTSLASLLIECALTQHQRHHGVDAKTGKRVSFGLIRMANIDPLFDVARAFFSATTPPGCRIHVCVYHARHPMVVRAAIERELDATLKRHDEEAVFAQPSVRARLDAGGESDHLFIVLATAVAEVGRDHDYDWAIIEPSSMRSIIQLAGRVWRHRKRACSPDEPNILLLDTNLKHLESGSGCPAFTKPGFETSSSSGFPLKSHRLTDLLMPEQWRVIDARARIRPRAKLDPTGNLVDLEHARLADQMLGAQPGHVQVGKPVKWWWETPAHLTGVIQQNTPFRHDPQGSQIFALLPDEDCTAVGFFVFTDAVPFGESDQGNLLLRFSDDELMTGQGIEPWGVPDYLPALLDLAEAFGMDPLDCARKFGTVDLPGRSEEGQRWRYHPVLGFSRWDG